MSENAARPSWSDPIAKTLTFAQMKLHPVKTPAGGVRYIGRQNTYTVKGVGVFQREKQESRLIWAFAAKQKIPRKLGWQQRARGVASRWLEENITRAYLKTLK